MKKIPMNAGYLVLLVLIGSLSGQNSNTEKNLQLQNSNYLAKTATIDTLQIELTLQAGSSIDSSAGLGSCPLASDYDETVNFPDFISYTTNQVTVGNFGTVRAYFTIAVSLSAPVGIYKPEVIYTIYSYGNECRSRLLLFTINVISPQQPVADFAASPTAIVEGGTVHFSDKSLNVITDWYWDFGDGNVSIEKNPAHSYTTAGSYTVSHTVTGPAGSDRLTKPDYISVLPKGTPGGQLWNFETQWEMTSSTAIDEEGTIYIGSYEGNLYAINPDGTEKWRYTAGDVISSSVIGNDGRIYITAKNWLEAIDTDGSNLWSYTIWGDVWDLAVGLDGIVYIITSRSEHTLQAINPDGEMIWSLSLGWSSGIPMRISIAADGTIYGVEYLTDSNTYRLYAISPKCDVKWTKEVPIPFDYRSKIAINNDGTVYLGGYTKFYAINPDGSEKWTYSGVGGDFKFEPTIDKNGNIYIAYDKITKQYIMSFNKKGDLNWSFEVQSGNYPNNRIISSVTVGADQMLYFTVADSNLYALNPDGTLGWKFKFEDFQNLYSSFESAPTIRNDKTLLVGFANKLYAVKTTSSGLADSPWPKAGQNLKNTGRKINPAPYLVSPENDSIQVPPATSLKWSTIAGATQYELEIDTHEDFSGSFIYRAQLTETSQFVENLQLSTQYYWHVRASSVEGLSEWSPTWKFTTELELPEAPILLSPSDGDSLSTDDILFRWKQSTRADSYQLLVSSDSLFSTIHLDTTISDTTIKISDLNIGLTYYWRTRGINISGEGEWSKAGSFTKYLEKPMQTILVLPVNGDTLTMSECTLTWQGLAKTDSYQLQLATESLFAEVKLDTIVSDTSLTINTLEIGINYFWRVRGINASGEGEWSEFRVFYITYPARIDFTDSIIPKSYELNQNYPNPFNPITKIRYAIPKGDYVTIKVFDITGRKVLTLVEEIKPAGSYEVLIDGHNLASGIYYYQFKSRDYQMTRKCLLLK